MNPLNTERSSFVSILMWTVRRGSPVRSGSQVSSGSWRWSSYGVTQMSTQSRDDVRSVDMSKRTTASPPEKSTNWFGVR